MTREEMGKAADAVNKEAERRTFITMLAIAEWSPDVICKRLWVECYHAKKRELLGL